MPHNTDDKGKTDLSQVEPLRSVEEVEEAAYPGLSKRERRLEQRGAQGEENIGADDDSNRGDNSNPAQDVWQRNVVIGAAQMPNESTILSSPAGSGAAPGPVLVSTLDGDDLDDKVDEDEVD